MANPLCLIMPLQEGIDLKQLLGVIQQSQPAIDQALEEIGSVHTARFVLFDRSQPNLHPTATSTGPYDLGLFTVYDGSFEAYIQDFARSLAPVFDALLSATTDGAEVVPVKDHPDELIEWMRKNDASQQPPNSQFPFYMAYPYTVQQILAAGS